MKTIGWLAAAILAPLIMLAQDAAPNRTILENRVTQGKDKDKAPDTVHAPENAVDSLLSATDDLNSIRDGYLKRLAGDGCRSEVAVRVAELRWQLQQDGAAAGRPQNSPAPQQTNLELADSLMILAAGWYRPHADTTPASARREPDRAQLLELVLPKSDSPEAAPATADSAQLKAELERLLATCRAGAR